MRRMKKPLYERVSKILEVSPSPLSSLVKSVIITKQGETPVQVTIPIVTESDLNWFLWSHYDWCMLCRGDSTDFFVTDFANRWNTFFDRKKQIIEDWFTTTINEESPLASGHSVTTSKTEYDGFGYSDKHLKQNSGANTVGAKHGLTFDWDGLEMSVGEASDDYMTTSGVSVGESKSTTVVGADTASIDVSFDLAEGTASASGEASGNSPMTTSHYTGTYDRTAASDASFTDRTEQEGASTNIGGSASNSATQSHGSSLADSGEMFMSEHTQEGTMTQTTEHTGFEANLLERMKEYMKLDLTKWILEEFAKECLFYVGGGEDGIDGGLWCLW